MLTEQQIWQLAEAAHAGQLTPEQSRELELRLADDAAFAQAYQESFNLLQSMQANGAHRRFKSMLKDIHYQQHIPKPAAKRITLHPQSLRMAAMAAGVALFTSLATIWTMRRSEPKATTSRNIQLLVHEIDRIKQSQNQQQRQIQGIQQQASSNETTQMEPSNYTGTGFALSNDGYIITNYHVTEGADSVYIQTHNGRYYKANVIAFHPKTDLAVLKVQDKAFRFGKSEPPYTFAPSKAGLGAHIYTLGFPQDDIVYNEGYISSRNGYEGDSMQYRLEVTAGPGQSGAPVLDNSGNVVAIIRSKESDADNITYAVSSKALLRLLRDLPKEVGSRMPKSGRLGGYSREQQIQKLQDYTCMIQVYKNQ